MEWHRSSIIDNHWKVTYSRHFIIHFNQTLLWLQFIEAIIYGIKQIFRRPFDIMSIDRNNMPCFPLRPMNLKPMSFWSDWPGIKPFCEVDPKVNQKSVTPITTMPLNYQWVHLVYQIDIIFHGTYICVFLLFLSLASHTDSTFQNGENN